MDTQTRIAQAALDAANGANAIALWALIASIVISSAGLFFSIIGWRLKPKLSVHLYREGDTTYFGEQSKLSDGSHAVFYHLAVKNRTGWIPAKGTKVVIKTVYDRCGVRWKERHIAGNLRLSWQHWTEEPDNPFRTVGPDVYVADFCVVEQRGAALMLANKARPAIFPGELVPEEELLLKIVAISEEATSPPLFLRLKWDGTFFGTVGSCTPQEFWEGEHLIIERHAGV